MKTGKSMFKWVFIPSSIILFVIIFMTSNKSNKKDLVVNTQNKKEVSIIKTRWIIDSRKTINYTGEYDEVIYTPTDRAFSFENSSEPYCVKNTADMEVCGQKAEDVSPKIPAGNANTGLMFKSTNGKSGHIVFVTWVKVEERI